MIRSRLTLLYDGSCPICAWEMRRLERSDRAGRLGFVDIQAPGFDPDRYGVTLERLMARLHGVMPDGRFLVGVDALIIAYRAVGWWWVWLPLSVIPRPLAARAYAWFADHRQLVSRRLGRWLPDDCDGDRCRRRGSP